MGASDEGSRRDVVTFRVNKRERRELDLLARAEGATRSELLRELIEKRAENVTREPDGE